MPFLQHLFLQEGLLLYPMSWNFIYLPLRKLFVYFSVLLNNYHSPSQIANKKDMHATTRCMLPNIMIRYPVETAKLLHTCLYPNSAIKFPIHSVICLVAFIKIFCCDKICVVFEHCVTLVLTHN
jgi:hypothetical protein